MYRLSTNRSARRRIRVYGRATDVAETAREAAFQAQRFADRGLQHVSRAYWQVALEAAGESRDLFKDCGAENEAAAMQAEADTYFLMVRAKVKAPALVWDRGEWVA